MKKIFEWSEIFWKMKNKFCFCGENESFFPYEFLKMELFQTTIFWKKVFANRNFLRENHNKNRVNVIKMKKTARGIKVWHLRKGHFDAEQLKCVCLITVWECSPPIWCTYLWLCATDEHTSVALCRILSGCWVCISVWLWWRWLHWREMLLNKKGTGKSSWFFVFVLLFFLKFVHQSQINECCCLFLVRWRKRHRVAHIKTIRCECGWMSERASWVDGIEWDLFALWYCITWNWFNCDWDATAFYIDRINLFRFTGALNVKNRKSTSTRCRMH